MTSGGNNFNDFPKKLTDQKSPKSPNLDHNLEACQSCNTANW